MFNPELIRIINSGRCFVLVGAGASMEMGYPSWRKLAIDVRDRILRHNPTADAISYQHFLTINDLPAVFRQAEIDLGGRLQLIALVKELFAASTDTSRATTIYDYLAKWPFACYMTTNYDNELYDALRQLGIHFHVVGNSAADLSNIRDGVSHLIIKLHSDLDHPNQIILTSRDYDRFTTADEGKYFRDKLRQVFEMFNVLIVGHSMSDPDLKLILATAKQTASTLRPLYMIVSNSTPGQAREYLEKFNIHLIPYNDADGSHTHLRRLLSVTDRFISPRNASSQTPVSIDEMEIQAATSLFIHRKLRAVIATHPINQLLGPLVLGIVASAKRPLNFTEVVSDPAISSLVKTHDLHSKLIETLDQYLSTGELKKDGEEFTITDAGKEGVSKVLQERRLEEEQALGQFEIDFYGRCTSATPEISKVAREALRAALVASFRSRGLAMANVIIAGQSLRADELPDIFRNISVKAFIFADFDQRAAFIESAHHFIVEPSGPQKNYLASISQGYFLYHLAGLDPTCAKIRREILDCTCWFLDSSVLIPLLAIGSYNHPYASDLFGKLRDYHAQLFTTERLLEELWRHLTWALERIKEFGVDSPEFLAAATSRDGYKQNLFIDGYVQLASEGAIGTFAEYLENVLGPKIDRHQFLKKISNFGITVLRVEALEGYSQQDLGEITELQDKLAHERMQRGTYRGKFQVEAEAEVLEIIKNVRRGQYKLHISSDSLERVYFMSQSHALDLVSGEGETITWTPEAVYRYVSSMQGVTMDPELLQQCMLHNYFYAGISFIDRPRYVKFFGPSISQAKLAYREQRDKYLTETEQTYRARQFDDIFEHIPDLEKPFFVAQMGWEVARIAEGKASAAAEREARAEERARLATAQAKAAQQDAIGAKKAKARLQHEANRIRNLGDPNHLRKRERQAKKRKQKKRR